jgi:hypothetical protein
VRRADNLTTFVCRLSRNLGASTSWNPKGLSRPVMGLLFTLLHLSYFAIDCNITLQRLRVCYMEVKKGVGKFCFITK